MKLFLSLLFSASLAAFSQSKPVNPDSLLKKIDALIARCKKMGAEMDAYERKNPWLGDTLNQGTLGKPDTLRALILATMCRKCAAEAIRGYVVIEQYKRPVYLDCHKRALKRPQVGWGWVEVVRAGKL